MGGTSSSATRPSASSRASPARRLQRLLKAAVLPPRRYHDLRPAAASVMAAQGVPVRSTTEIIDHSDIRRTMNIYAHIATEIQRDPAARVAGVLWHRS